MTKKKARLGRGLDALLGDPLTLNDEPGIAPDEEFKVLSVTQLQPGKYQPRQVMDKPALEELASSIKAQGIVQPILVRAVRANKYEIVAGERRWRAAQIAGLAEVPVIVRVIPDEAAVAVALIENIQRENLSALEEARGIARLLAEFGLTHQQAADNIGRSRAAVSNLLRLLQLAPKVQEMLEQKVFEMGHARTLLGLPEPMQFAAAVEISNKHMSVRQAEQYVKQLLEKDGRTTAVKKPIDPNIEALQQSLCERLNASVSIQNSGNKGKLVIQYHSLDELDGILARIQ